MISNRYINDGVAAKNLNQVQLSARDSVLNKLSTGIYKSENVNCPICYNMSFETLSEKDCFGINCSVVICNKCGLIQLNPRMTKEAYARFYNTEYRMFDAKSVDAYYDKQYRRGESIYNTILRYSGLDILKGAYVVEVGCGAGGILKYFRDRGCIVKGYDYGEEYLEYGRSACELDLELGGIDNYQSSVRPDIIIYSHVLEHVLDLNSELNRCHRILDDEGIMYIEVPSFKRIAKGLHAADILRSFQIAHAYYFSSRSLSNLLQKNSFEMVFGDEHVRSIFKKATGSHAQYLNDYKEAMRFISIAERLRIFNHIVPIYFIKRNAIKIMRSSLSYLGIKDYVSKSVHKLRRCMSH